MTGRRSHGRLSALNGVVHQGTVALNPVPNYRVVHFQAALAEQFFDSW